MSWFSLNIEDIVGPSEIASRQPTDGRTPSPAAWGEVPRSDAWRQLLKRKPFDSHMSRNFSECLGRRHRTSGIAQPVIE